MNNKVRVFRSMRGLTQEQLAEQLEVSRQTVIAIESNRYLPSLPLAFKLAKLFNCRIEELFFTNGSSK